MRKIAVMLFARSRMTKLRLAVIGRKRAQTSGYTGSVVGVR
jgi:hypothetical protein